MNLVDLAIIFEKGAFTQGFYSRCSQFQLGIRRQSLVPSHGDVILLR